MSFDFFTLFFNFIIGNFINHNSIIRSFIIRGFIVRGFIVRGGTEILDSILPTDGTFVDKIL